jgi:hypothetical protein
MHKGTSLTLFNNGRRQQLPDFECFMDFESISRKWKAVWIYNFCRAPHFSRQ